MKNLGFVKLSRIVQYSPLSGKIEVKLEVLYLSELYPYLDFTPTNHINTDYPYPQWSRMIQNIEASFNV